jgi:hypothetical protein
LVALAHTLQVGPNKKSMSDLPLFLQMFVRFFAALAFGAGLYLASSRNEQKPQERETRPEVRQQDQRACQRAHMDCAQTEAAGQTAKK